MLRLLSARAARAVQHTNLSSLPAALAQPASGDALIPGWSQARSPFSSLPGSGAHHMPLLTGSWDEREQAKAQGARQHQLLSGFAKLASEQKVELHPGMKKQQVMAGALEPTEWTWGDRSYTAEYMESLKPMHKPPVTFTEKMAYWAIQGTRASFDWVTSYKHDVPQSEAQWLRRIVFLETVAGVPGMVGGVLRHLRSLRLMKADKGWIGSLLEEAENERMHLLVFLQMRQPEWYFKAAVLIAQGVYWNVFFLSYLMAPKFCHAVVGYLEEEAVRTYTHLIEDIDAGHVWKDQKPPPIAITYWHLGENATMRDLALAVRADEASHSHVNHKLSETAQDAPNPFMVVKGGSVNTKEML